MGEALTCGAVPMPNDHGDDGIMGPAGRAKDFYDVPSPTILQTSGSAERKSTSILRVASRRFLVGSHLAWKGSW